MDLKDAYFHVRVVPAHRQYLRFNQFKALPFGLSWAPRVFTKTLALLIVWLKLSEYSYTPTSMISSSKGTRLVR